MHFPDYAEATRWMSEAKLAHSIEAQVAPICGHCNEATMTGIDTSGYFNCCASTQHEARCSYAVVCEYCGEAIDPNGDVEQHAHEGGI